MITVKMTYPEVPDTILKPDILPPDISFQTPKRSCIWGNCEFHINKDIEKCDFWVVFDDLPEKESAICPRSNTIFVTAEPESVKKYNKRFLEQFGTVITAQEHIAHPHVITTHQILPWYVHKTYDELVTMSPPEKKCLLSIVSSNKRFSKGHEQRYQFALALKSYFGDRIDLFGRGIRGFDDKWDVLAPYKYSIVIENSSSPYYVTEKLTEAFLSYTFPIYYGCTNLEEYYPRGSFETIDIWDIDGAIGVIERILMNNSHYSDHLEALCTARKLYLDTYQLFPLLNQIICQEMRNYRSYAEFVSLRPSSVSYSDILFKLRCFRSVVLNSISKFC